MGGSGSLSRNHFVKVLVLAEAAYVCWGRCHFFGMPVSAEAGKIGTALLWLPGGVDGLQWAVL